MADLPCLLRTISEASDRSPKCSASPNWSSIAEELHDRLTQCSASPVQQDKPVCRICLEDATDEELFRPCLCKGTMQHVHKGCLQKWRLTSSNSKSYFRCEQCLYSYNLRRVFLADMLAVTWLPYVFTTLVMLTCNIACTWIAVRLWGQRFGSRFWWLKAMGAGSMLFGISAFFLLAMVDAEIAALRRTVLTLFKTFLANAHPSAQDTLLLVASFIWLALVGLWLTTQTLCTMALRTSRVVIGMIGDTILNVDEV